MKKYMFDTNSYNHILDYDMNIEYELVIKYSNSPILLNPKEKIIYVGKNIRIY